MGSTRWKKWGFVVFLFMGLAPWGACFVEARPEASDGTPEALASTYATPQALVRFLRQEIRFERDDRLFGQPDYWQTPEEFLQHRAGDCEDYALLAQSVLERQGREAFVFSLYGESGYAHTICVFLEEGRYNVINQDRLIGYQARSLEELAALLCPRWKWAAIAVQQGHRGCALKRIYNPAKRSLLQ